MYLSVRNVNQLYYPVPLFLSFVRGSERRKGFLLRHASYVNEQKTLDFVKAGTSALAVRLRTSVHRHRIVHIYTILQCFNEVNKSGHVFLVSFFAADFDVHFQFSKNNSPYYRIYLWPIRRASKLNSTVSSSVVVTNNRSYKWVLSLANQDTD